MYRYKKAAGVQLPPGMETSAGAYDIRNVKRKDGQEWYALGFSDSSASPWGVWRWSKGNGFYWGHYFKKEDEAVKYFNKAAKRSNMYRYQSQRKVALPRTVEKEVYKFDELDDQAKDKAREWWRDGALDYEWWDFLEEQFKEDGEKKGFDIDKMYFSGFASQGDGASWEGSVDLLKLIHSEGAEKQFPSFVKLMEEMGGEDYEDYHLNITHSGHYYHSNTMHGDDIRAPSVDNYEDADDWSEDEVDKFDEALEREVEELNEWGLEQARYYAQDYYQALEKEYDWLMADENVDENIMVNEYEFNEDGSIF